MNPNYPSASEVIRNVADLKAPYHVLRESGKFRIIEIDAPYFGGYAFWVINEKGFLWEPALSLEGAEAYLNSPEARQYQSE